MFSPTKLKHSHVLIKHIKKKYAHYSIFQLLIFNFNYIKTTDIVNALYFIKLCIYIFRFNTHQLFIS